MRRKPGALVPLELAICVCGVALRHDGVEEFYGYEIAKRLRDLANHKVLIAYGTLYRALERLEAMGLLRSRWEDPGIAARENRPRRRLYTVTAAAEAAARDADTSRQRTTAPLRRRPSSA